MPKLQAALTALKYTLLAVIFSATIVTTVSIFFPATAVCR